VTGQEIQFFRAPDGVRLAYTSHGDGRPLVNVSCWLSHLQYDWESPVWRHLLADLGAFSSLVRFDERGSGLSDWQVPDYSIDARVADLETIVDRLGLERFDLLGISQGGPIAINYAVRHPERVSHMVLLGAYARGSLRRDPSPEHVAEFEAMLSLVRVGWARESPVFRRVFTNIFIPDASDEQVDWFDELQRKSTSAENAVRMRLARAREDVSDMLPSVRVSTLVMHSRGDQAVPFEEGVRLATSIPGARFVPLESRNHILVSDEPAWPQFVSELGAFIETDDRRPIPAPAPGLSSREAEVLRLAADRLSNLEIADALTLSVRTVERHFENIYAKLGVSGRTARAGAVGQFLRGRLGTGQPA
jgi:pimeloyl-ACP methyl ester carboxylesterase/DNA-binding CsgD family transcriptional regulator